jgi:hypothetical protein
MKARYPLQETHSRKQELLAAMRSSVETELDFARQCNALGVWSLLYLPHPDFLSCGSIACMGKTPGQALLKKG